MRYEHYHNCIKFSKINNVYVYERTQANKASFYLTVQIKGAHVDGRGLLCQLESRKRAALALFTFTPSLHEARKVKLQRRPQNVRDVKTMGHLTKNKNQALVEMVHEERMDDRAGGMALSNPTEHRRCHSVPTRCICSCGIYCLPCWTSVMV